MKGMGTAWHEDNGKTMITWHVEWFDAVTTKRLTGGALTHASLRERLQRSHLRGERSGSATRETVELTRWASSETVNHVPSILGRTKILRVISESLSASGVSDEQRLANTVNAVIAAAEQLLTPEQVAVMGNIEITLQTGF